MSLDQDSASAPATGSAPVWIFGAGKTGRGFLAHLCHDAGLAFVLVDRDAALIESLRAEGSYTVRVLASPERTVQLRPQACYTTDEAWQEPFADVNLCFTAVFGNNLDALGETLSAALAARFAATSPLRLNVLTAENLSGAAERLRTAVLERIVDRALRARVDSGVGFSESIVLKTCLAPGPEDHPLTIRAQDFFELPCDAAHLRGPLPPVPGLESRDDFEHQLVRKLYTYNCINAVLTYLGARKGETLLSAAAADADTYSWARRAGEEASRALVSEFGFDSGEQDAWQAAALAKFSDPRIPDPLSRNGADPRRKLGRDDRLVGPARLVLKHGGEPRAIAEGLFAAFHFSDADEPSLLETYQDDGIALLQDVCGLSPGDPLYDYLVALWEGTQNAR